MTSQPCPDHRASELDGQPALDFAESNAATSARSRRPRPSEQDALAADAAALLDQAQAGPRYVPRNPEGPRLRQETIERERERQPRQDQMFTLLSRAGFIGPAPPTTPSRWVRLPRFGKLQRRASHRSSHGSRRVRTARAGPDGDDPGGGESDPEPPHRLGLRPVRARALRRDSDPWALHWWERRGAFWRLRTLHSAVRVRLAGVEA